MDRYFVQLVVITGAPDAIRTHDPFRQRQILSLFWRSARKMLFMLRASASLNCGFDGVAWPGHRQHSGWVGVDGMDGETMQNIPDGAASLIEAKGNFSIDVDGKPQEVRPIDSFQALGAFRGVGTSNGKLRFVGNQERKASEPNEVREQQAYGTANRAFAGMADVSRLVGFPPKICTSQRD
ncbi:hypothetical protein NKI01_28940 [Mesorhizobium sp. M0815]|uniref:hypothetical protein n=1 Tax=Mesorhizobium sp. M0815 TaxID=2957005 RepID=UPI003337CBAD